MKYMLDTNIIAYAKNKRPESVLQKIQEQQPGDMCISSITMAELEYGVCNSSRPDTNRLALIMFLTHIPILPFDSRASAEYGRIRYELSRTGNIIGANDLLIAAHAKALDLTLVTNNEREFSRVDGLRLENWVK